jgi:2-polyprenyl-6-methoxyphenol hydroxylase-like FAD-dependent oxidoreductase
MKITCIGGGPGGLWFAIAATLLDPGHEITVLERRPPDTTYGWGIVYWDDLLDGVRRVDPETARELTAGSVQWAGQRVVIQGGPPVHLGGSGYSMGRRGLIDVLVRRARSLGVRIEFERDVDDLAAAADADLVVLSDGANSRHRKDRAEYFGTQERTGRNKHIWLGSRVPFADFTFAFEETAAGWIWFHAYRFCADVSTVIVECTEDTWSRLGFGSMDEEACLKELGRIFARHLDGVPLDGRPEAGGGTQWASFPTISNEHWHAGNVVLLGDSAHTSHFSIGSGTRAAFEDAAALARAVASRSPEHLPSALATYESNRLPAVQALQRDAARSAAWFENVERTIHLDPVDFGYSLRMRREVTATVGAEPRRSSVPYRLHRATQWRVGRAARRTFAATRRVVRSRSSAETVTRRLR